MRFDHTADLELRIENGKRDRAGDEGAGRMRPATKIEAGGGDVESFALMINPAWAAMLAVGSVGILRGSWRTR